MIAAAVDVSIDPVLVTSEILGGTERVVTEATESPALVIVRPKAFEPESSGGGSPAVTVLGMPDIGRSGSATVTERHVEEHEGPDLEAASIVVSGGRGVGDADNWHLVEELAGQLGAAPPTATNYRVAV